MPGYAHDLKSSLAPSPGPASRQSAGPQPEVNPQGAMKAKPASRDHRERAEELLADIAGEAHTDRELTTMAAVAEAVLAVVDVLEGLRAAPVRRAVVPPPGPHPNRPSGHDQLP